MLGLALMIIVGLAVVLITMMIRDYIYWRSKGVPATSTFPLLGLFAPVLFRKRSMAEWVIDVYNICPGTKYFGSTDFQTSVLVLKDPEIIKDIGVKNFTYFPNHQSFVNDEFDPIFAKNVFSLKDDRWREMRTILTPTFTANKMKYMFQLVSKCSSDFATYLLEHPELMKELDLKDIYTRYTNDVIATSVFGISVNSLKDPKNEFYLMGKEATDFGSASSFVKMIAARIMPKIMRLLGLKFLSARADRFFKVLIAETINERETKGIVRPDMINIMMEARNNENSKMTIDDITAQALIFFFAGFETSAQFMCYVSHVLSHYPEIQERLRNEVDAILEETNGDVTYEALSRMKYMDMVLAETLRMYPPQPFTDRVCRTPYEIPAASEKHKAFVVPEEMILWIPVYAFHHDPDYFPDPETFDPERFNDENKDNINPYTYMPFGFGPRKCIGDRFVLMETKLIITRFLQAFYLKPSPKSTKIITFAKNGGMMVPEKGFWIRLEPRIKKSVS